MGSTDTNNTEERGSGSAEWLLKWSRSKPGKCYYFNVRTGESSWIRPKGVEVEAEDGSTPQEPKELKRKSTDKTKQIAKKFKTCPATTCVIPTEELKPQSVDNRNALTSNCALDFTEEIVRPPMGAVKDRGNSKLREASCPLPASSSTLTQCQRSAADNGSNSAQSLVGLNQLPDIYLRKKKRAKRKKKKSSLKADEPDACVKNAAASSKTNLKVAPVKNTAEFHTAPENKSTGPSNETKHPVIGSVGETSDSLKHKQRDKTPAQSRLKNIHGSLQTRSKPYDSPKTAMKGPESSTVQQDLGNSNHFHKLIQKEISRDSLERLQGAHLERSCTLEQIKVSKNELHLLQNVRNDNVKLTAPDSAQKRLEYLRSELQDVACSNIVKVKARHSAQKRLENFQSILKAEQDMQNGSNTIIPALQGYNVTTISSLDENAMEVEYMESDVLCDIGELRQTDVAVEFNEQLIFMDVDIDQPMININLKSIIYVVLDTNILLSHLKFVEGLCDIILPGKGPVHLFLPWQVLHELDHLKDRGKPNIQPLARRAIHYLHENFSSKHPRFRGQKLSEAVKNTYDCPDDNILQSCLQLKDQGYDVILLSNDVNLLNKALVSELNALSKDQFLKQFYESSVKYSESSVSVNTKTMTKENEKSLASLNDFSLCELKTILKQALTEVVSKGMEDEYKHLWKKRTIIAPPWEVGQVLHCLSSHWLPVCGDFLPPLVKTTIEELKEFFKIKAKGFVRDSDLQEGLNLSKAVLKSISNKYCKTVDTAIQKIEGLLLKIEESAPKPTMTSGNTQIVFLCFQEAHNAAHKLCHSNIHSDPDLKQKVASMIPAVTTFIHLLTGLLSKPVESLNEEDPTIIELVSLIKGVHCITPQDIVNFCKEDRNRELLKTGLGQFTSFKLQLTAMMESINMSMQQDAVYSQV